MLRSEAGAGKTAWVEQARGRSEGNGGGPPPPRTVVMEGDVAGGCWVGPQMGQMGARGTEDGEQRTANGERGTAVRISGPNAGFLGVDLGSSLGARSIP